MKVAAKAEEQLIEEIERLRQEVDKLRQEKTARKQAEHNLTERVKELECLYGIAAIAEKPGITLDELYQEVANLLPSSWQYPEICCARITIEDKEFRTANYRDAKWKLCSDIKIGGVKAGTVEVNYLEKRPELDEGPFLREERRLIDAVAEQMGRITERKEAEETLRESEEKFRTFVDSASNLMSITDRAGNFTDVNAAMVRVLGYSKKELIGMHITQLLTKEALERDFKPNWERFTKRGEITFDTTYATKDGKEIYGELKAVAVYDSDGKYAGGRAVFHDLTERKQAEEELWRSGEKYRTTLENVVEGYYEVDLAGNFTIVNDATCRNLGYSRDELIGMNNRDYMDEQTAKKVLERYVKVYTTGQPARGFEFEVIRKNGTKLVTSSSVSLITDSQGQPTGFRGIVRNISAEKQAEEMLRQSEEKYRTILESIEHGYFEVDIRGNFTFFNDSMCEILGYTRDEMLGMNNRQYMDKKNAWKVYQTFNKVYTTGESAQGFDWEFIRKDGTKRIVEAPVSLIRDAEAKPIGFRGIVRDITEHRKAEIERKTLEQRAQVASRLSIVGEMASGILHEMNNPLTSIIGFAHLLAQQDLPEDAKEYARIINNDGQRVATIAGRLLNFARHKKPEIVYANINQVIENTLQLQAYEMAAANIKVTTKLDPAQPQTMADVGQLQQVFLNITLNAKTEMRAAHGKGKLLVKIETIDNIIRISFKDNGPGIPQKNLERIFEPFFTTRELGKGTGLGLSICYEIITNHNGQIYAESTLGKGATFIIELPVVARQRRTARTARANGNNLWR